MSDLQKYFQTFEIKNNNNTVTGIQSKKIHEKILILNLQEQQKMEFSEDK